MTRKDYIALAAAISAAHPDMPCEAIAHAQWRTMRDKIADVLARDNSRFDRDRFTAACRPQRVED